MTDYSIDWVNALAKADMMAIEAVVSRICRDSCEGLTGFAIFDGGAHTGFHTVPMSELPGCEFVYAVEADPAMAEVLKKKLRDAKEEPFQNGDTNRTRASVAIIEMALQNDPKLDAITWKSSTSHVGRSSILSESGETIWRDSENIEYRDETRVPATTIDTILLGESRPVPFLKLDLEGADILSLFGAKQTLKTKRPVVAFENSRHAPNVHGFTLEDFRNYLSDLDYVAMSFAGERLEKGNWFGFFEAWLVPTERADWLSERLTNALSMHDWVLPHYDKANELRDRAFDPVRLAQNIDDTLVEEANTALPAATRTVGWRNLSLAVATALREHPLFKEQSVEAPYANLSWEEARSDYLKRVRSVMRSLTKEGMEFRQLRSYPDYDKSSAKWAQDSARFAWLLWLSGRRAVHTKDEAEERALWTSQSEAYRKYVRAALADLRDMGIVFADECALGE